MATAKVRHSAGGRARDHRLQSRQPHELAYTAKHLGVPQSRVLEALEGGAKTHKQVKEWLGKHYGVGGKVVDAIKDVGAALTGSKEAGRFKVGDKVKIGSGKKEYEVVKKSHTKELGWEYGLKGAKKPYLDAQLA